MLSEYHVFRPPVLTPVPVPCVTGYPGDVTGELEPSSDDSVHVHLHNASHGAMLSGDTLHEVHATVLEHNDTHSVLHINSSTAGLHRDVLVHSGKTPMSGVDSGTDTGTDTNS